MKTAFYIVLTLIIFSCKQSKEAEVIIAPSQVEDVTQEIAGDLNETSGTIPVTFELEYINAIYESYLDLKAALVNTNAGDVASIASDIEEMIKEMNGTDQQLSKLTSFLEKMAASSEVKKQRLLFENVTDEVEKLLSGKVTSGKVIKQYCPMAFDGKGAYWLSNSKEIRNPYFGDKMLKCGVVDIEIQ
ncbi:DUF3347 domain-containing protein [Dokdonia sp. Hel_I_53]|uniref:DUF3347 domain-containing protein n=1 Tax=Dokdonia sp. Hel_I_53 TaxID=1566287 RepID=UPI00119A944A|nr:DUF3347 domain-containing protein [Dokdonia sp. Hel_I_53]TVZ52163.1 uncharacterized protein DUF3347 [Dokdonia sp. Hel_I_53]